MKNPLRKRLFKEFKAEIGKYLVIFIFMTATIGLISGFTVASSSMKIAYDNSFEKYNVEWGHFTVAKELSDELISDIEKDNKVTMISDYYKNLDTTPEAGGKSPDDKIRTIRLYKNRDVMNKICIMKGRLAETDDEIAIDRMYAVNNEIEVGDTITVDGTDFKVTGYTAFPDYSCLFQDNNDTMFDSLLFTVGITTENAYDSLDESKEVFNYAWQYENEPADKKAEKVMSDDFLENIVGKIYATGNSLDIYIPRYQNRAINFTGDDLGGDTVMMFTLLYIVMVIMAFVFAVTTNNTILTKIIIEKNTNSISMTKILGYTNREINGLYMTANVWVVIISTLIGIFISAATIKPIFSAMMANYVSGYMDCYIAPYIYPLMIVISLVVFLLVQLTQMKKIKSIPMDEALKNVE